jgi:hypothetical protein
MDQLDVHGGLGASTQNVFTGNGVLSAMAPVKAQLASLGHQDLAAHGANVAPVWADNFFQAAAQNPANAAPLSGAAVGMNVAQTAETNLAKGLLSSLGLQSLATDLRRKEGKQLPIESIDEEKEIDAVKVRSDNFSPETVERLFEEALTGKTPRPFVFVSNRGQVISQRIVAEQKPRLPERTKTKRQKIIMCHFCDKSVQSLTEAYYRCQECSSNEANFDICEACVAGLGCGCPRRDEHMLERLGKLDTTVNRGELIDIQETKGPKEAQSTKTGSKRAWMQRLKRRRGVGAVHIADEKESEVAALIDQAEKDGMLHDDDDADSIFFFDAKE